jgi:hypothetical protein
MCGIDTVLGQMPDGTGQWTVLASLHVMLSWSRKLTDCSVLPTESVVAVHVSAVYEVWCYATWIIANMWSIFRKRAVKSEFPVWPD